jgi:colicin import membrane protein
MALVSLIIHGLAILLIIAVSFSFSKPKNAHERMSVEVKLTQAPEGPPLMERVGRGPVEEAPAIAPAEIIETPPSAESQETSREVVETRFVTQPKAEPVPLAKRKKPLKRLEAEREPEKREEPKKKKETAQKKEDPDAYLAKKKAEIAEQVAAKRKEALAATSGGHAKPGGQSGRRVGGEMDEELLRWFQGVKSRVSSHWSLMADPRQAEKFAKIGVKIAEDGALMDATVDESSGDQVFDRSAMRAVLQAAPFPPLTPELKAKITQAGGLAFRFTHRGIQ